MKLLALGAILASVTGASPATKLDEYEYVVVGSGPGGGTLAANLARAGHSVFLIEAGQDHGNTPLQRIPIWADAASEAADHSWQFFVNHFQNETQARRDNKFTYRFSNGSYYVGLDPPPAAEPLGILYPRGNTLGGSSQVNGMNFALPPDNDWRDIAKLTGDNSWLPENMRRYFMEVERNEYVAPGTEGHGFNGYIATGQNNITYVTSRAGVTAVAREGIRKLEGIDVQDPEELARLVSRDMNRLDTKRYEHQGVYQFPVHIDSRKRRSGARDLVADTVSARNYDGSVRYPLKISFNSLATKILFSNPTAKKTRPQACGVEYMVGEALYAADKRYNASQVGEIKQVKATREVIVAGGAFNTPQLLKLSGIGPRKELEKFKIPVLVDLPAVGKYMSDNYEGGITVEAHTPWENNPAADCKFELNSALNSTATEDPCLTMWQNDGVGPYGEGGATLAMWFRSSASTNNDSDIFLFGAPGVDFRGFFPGYADAVVSVPNTTFFWSIVKMQARNAAGTLTLRSANPRDTPIINFNFFEENGSSDLQALSEGFELAREIFNATGSPYTPYKLVEPQLSSGLAQGIKDYTFSHHVQSTCRMGPKGHSDYCVDSKFKVNGVDNLRVVDASVFPHPMGGFPVSATFMISRKAFHVITS
ncbi:hypothetical protein NQ176_g3172 [Zarea fungicola]|uniref:Uncharacterized protein n=1 Tax=Zarea fungicola TaxID=93591 RepID=A0ACC1NMC4_9HYPO|nr:hypothetical protein NQ176_g3172 [Lecanicillium fungicola]